jgi:hypothetical protein
MRGPTDSRFLMVVAACLAFGLLAGPAAAQTRGLFTARRAVGVALLGGSAFMAKEGLDLKDDADAYYAQYQRATVETEIERWYQLSNNRDIKSQVSWAVGAAFAIAGARLLLTRGPDPAPAQLTARPPLYLPGRLELAAGPAGQPLGVGVRRCFF